MKAAPIFRLVVDADELEPIGLMPGASLRFGLCFRFGLVVFFAFGFLVGPVG